MEVPVVVEIAENPPGDDLMAWDQVNECSIDAPSGRLVVAGCTDYFPDAARIELPAGTYRARIYYGNLTSLRTAWREEIITGSPYGKLLMSR